MRENVLHYYMCTLTQKTLIYKDQTNMGWEERYVAILG